MNLRVTAPGTAQDVAYALGSLTPALCCIAVIGVGVFFLVRHLNKR